MNRYTIVFEFRGGTYIEQINGDSVMEAANTWANNVKISDIKHLGEAGKSELINQIKTENPTPLNGLHHVWCISGILRSGYFLINIIQTIQP